MLSDPESRTRARYNCLQLPLIRQQPEITGVSLAWPDQMVANRTNVAQENEIKTTNIHKDGSAAVVGEILPQHEAGCVHSKSPDLAGWTLEDLAKAGYLRATGPLKRCGCCVMVIATIIRLETLNNAWYAGTRVNLGSDIHISAANLGVNQSRRHADSPIYSDIDCK
ncbi:hypothetical protein B0H10DRAFT_2195040 [Mycena sp. CBHHK59/15]|nr:hypothetical protein B0H10DRAFT_2195040 [Mycena sp. CBHHK59/15]